MRHPVFRRVESRHLHLLGGRRDLLRRSSAPVSGRWWSLVPTVDRGPVRITLSVTPRSMVGLLPEKMMSWTHADLPLTRPRLVKTGCASATT
jgi:hypothetical protein